MKPIEAFKYSESGFPEGYECYTCGVGGVKLWREVQLILQSRKFGVEFFKEENNERSLQSLHSVDV